MIKNISAGYTFIELLVVFAIVGIIGTLGTVSFIQFNDNKVLDAAASDLANSYTIARQRAISQVKPSVCTASQVLQGYEVVVTPATRMYQVRVRCGGAVSVISTKTISSQINFVGTPPTVLFNVPGGSVNANATITIQSGSKTKSISVQKSGAISIL